MTKICLSIVALALIAPAGAALPNLNWLPPDAAADAADETVSEPPTARQPQTAPQMLTPNTVSSDIAAMMRSMRGEIRRNVGTATQAGTAQPSSASQVLGADERLMRQYIVRGLPLKVEICSSTVDTSRAASSRGSADSRMACLVQGVSIGGPRGN